jgi:hypothetical protein
MPENRPLDDFVLQMFLRLDRAATRDSRMDMNERWDAKERNRQLAEPRKAIYEADINPGHTPEHVRRQMPD